MPNFIDLYRETNPGERRMQSAKGLKDEGFQGIVKAYQMGRGGSEASEYDTKRAEAAGKYAKRQEAMDSIKAMKDGSDIATNMFYSFMEQGDDEATASRKAGEAASDLLYPILGDSAKITNFKPTKDVEYFSMQVSEGNQNVVKFMARDKRSGALAEWNGQSYEPFKGIKLAGKKTAAEQGKKAETLEYISVLSGEPAIKLPPGEKPKAGYYRKGTKLSRPEERKLRRAALKDRGIEEPKVQQQSLWDRMRGKSTTQSSDKDTRLSDPLR
jgi:hypothetical protein